MHAESLPRESQIELYRWMVLCRRLERACCAGNPRWFPAEGEEATIVGTFFGLRTDDVVAPHYRGPFVVYAMRGAALARLVGQALGKSTGYSRGRSVPFTGPIDLNIVPWVAGDLGTSLGIATGAGLSMWYDRRLHPDSANDRVVVMSFGDGTANRGDFHETINMASLWKLPVVYVCQNNSFAISLHHSQYIPQGAGIASRAAGYGIPGVTVDGNDLLAVHAAVQEAVRRARRGDGPTLIEAITYRLSGHWAGDSANYRDPAELALRRDDDPVDRFEAHLLELGTLTRSACEKIQRSAQSEVDLAFAEASSASPAGPDDLGLLEVLPV